jgi:thiol-disulfide isomerase/thioredoxin
MKFFRWLGVIAAALTMAQPLQAGPVGKPAPKFTLTTFAKEKVTLDTIRGNVVVINHWATWCVPCRAEMPMLDAFQRKYRDDGLRIYAVTTEDSVPPYQLKKLSGLLSFPLSNKLRSSTLVPIGGAVPTSYVIDRKGVVRYAKAGAFDAQSFAELILPLLAEAP